jgi:hypothetical protein
MGGVNNLTIRGPGKKEFSSFPFYDGFGGLQYFSLYLLNIKGIDF